LRLALFLWLSSFCAIQRGTVVSPKTAVTSLVCIIAHSTRTFQRTTIGGMRPFLYLIDFCFLTVVVVSELCPFWRGVSVFCGYAAKNRNPTRMGWHTPVCSMSVTCGYVREPGSLATRLAWGIRNVWRSQTFLIPHQNGLACFCVHFLPVCKRSLPQVTPVDPLCAFAARLQAELVAGCPPLWWVLFRMEIQKTYDSGYPRLLLPGGGVTHRI
jgi:hypothetical protein